MTLNLLKGQGARFYLWLVKPQHRYLSRLAAILRNKLHVFVARFTVALAQKVYFFFSGGSRPSDMGGGGRGKTWSLRP